MGDPAAVFLAYDIRGLVPEHLDDDLAKRIGGAFARFVRRHEPDTVRVVVGRDMRESGVELAGAFAEGITSEGLGVVDLGLVSTDMLYFASGHLDAPGAVFTASHNPADYNGIKLCLSSAKPVGTDSGLAEIQADLKGVEANREPGGRTTTTLDLLDDFADHVRSFVDTTSLAPLKVVADTANGMGGLVVPAVFDYLPFDLEVIYGELDGTFPNHPPDPLQSANLMALQERVLSTGADLGLAFDGDADRVFLVDEAARPVSGSLTTALVAATILSHQPGATVIHNLICSRAVSEVISEHGGRAVRSRVGHSYIKELMATEGAAFAGEHSGHYYFAANYRADSGLIAALLVLEALSISGGTLSALLAPFDRYVASGEVNFSVEDPVAVIERVSLAYAARGSHDTLDGLTIDMGEWWFNLRCSNTEPLLRLNLEALNADDCTIRLSEVSGLITQ